MAVVIGVRCIDFMKSQLSIPIDQVYLLSDSHGYIKFDYVASKETPSDIASCGCSLDSLVENKL